MNPLHLEAAHMTRTAAFWLPRPGIRIRRLSGAALEAAIQKAVAEVEQPWPFDDDYRIFSQSSV